MRYSSTRGQSPQRSFCEIVLEGLAPDGGLYLPIEYPKISLETLNAWRTLPYPLLAFEIFKLFVDDIPSEDLLRITEQTYTPKIFAHSRKVIDANKITPLTCLEDGLFLQELSNGPTLAFKDMAMQFLGNLFSYILEKENRVLNIVGATSGDTGSAAEYAVKGKERIKIFMLSPHGKMSDFQRAQMYSLNEENVFNIALEGMFDDAQNIVKTLLNDADFKEKYHLGAVNSINWARLLAQIVYYFAGYFQATQSNEEKISFAVPTGNFGNICAGHIAKQMGLPIDNLILATNENDVLDEFFRTGIYRPRKSNETFVTSSPSMDISKASNFERFIFDFVDQDKTVVRQLWNCVEKGESFDLSGTVFWQKRAHFGFISGSSTHEDRLENIRLAYQKYRILLDPHTADALKIARAQKTPNNKIIVLETAQAAKFEKTVRKALGFPPARPTAFNFIEQKQQFFSVLPNETQAVKELIEQHAE